MSGVSYSNLDQGQVQRILPDLIRYRGLLRDLVSKDLRARYRNAMMGFLWAILQPLLFTLILTFVFTIVFQIGEREGYYQSSLQNAASILCGLVFWQFLSNGVMMGTQSLFDNQELIKKVHFPREIIPLSAICNAMVNLAIGFVTLLVIRALAWGMFGPEVVWVLPILAIQIMLVVGLSLMASAANLYYNDVHYMIEVGLTLGFYGSPILYRLEKVAGRVGTDSLIYKIYAMNPLAGLLAAYRQVLLEGGLREPELLVWPLLCAVVMLVVGAAFFRKMSPVFADYL